jgi:hypothetical protein
MLTTQELLEEAAKGDGGHANLAFIAGICLGLATSKRYDLIDEDRIYLARASEYLKRHSFAQYYEQHGRLP